MSTLPCLSHEDAADLVGGFFVGAPLDSTTSSYWATLRPADVQAWDEPEPDAYYYLGLVMTS